MLSERWGKPLLGATGPNPGSHLLVWAAEKGGEREEAAPENLWRGGAEDRSGHPPERQLMGAWAAWAPPRQPKDRAELWVARPRRPAFLIYLEPQKLRMRLQGAG